MLQIEQKRALLIGFIVHLYTISFITGAQDVKTWSSNTNFLNPRNWKNGVLPCANDRVIFPDSVITLMPETLSIGSLILPDNVEIILPQRMDIELTGGTREGSCTGKDVHFQATVDYWYDPKNWNITSDRAFPRIPSRRNLAVPHAFQVPCQTDKVRFPNNATFRTHVLYPLTKVAHMEINGVRYSQASFNNLLRTHVGSLLFPNNPRIRITSSACRNQSGCICGNDSPQVLPTICNQVTPRCPKLDCYDNVKPVGSCCPICGGMILIKPKKKFSMSKLIRLYNEVLSPEETRGVESFTAKTYDGNIQSVFVDGKSVYYKGQANHVAQFIFNQLMIAKGRKNSYSIDSAMIYRSDYLNSRFPPYEHVSGGMSSGGISALVIFFIILGLAAAYYVYKKRPVPGFNFARFDLHGSKIELELGTTPHDELQPVDSPAATNSEEEHTLKGFDNPVFGTAVEEVPSEADEPPETTDFVENPMFMIFEESSKQGTKEKE